MDTSSTSGSTNGLNVLVPVDGSEIANLALAYAGMLPLAGITIVHVVNEDQRVVGLLEAVERAEWASPAQPDLEGVAESFRSRGIPTTVDFASGDIAEHIVSLADGHDMIVMTTTGRGAAGRMLFGSVADRVSRVTTVPVLLIRARNEAAIPRLPTRLVVPVDGSERSQAALSLAGRIAGLIPAPLHVVRAMELDDVLARTQQTRFRDEQGKLIPIAELEPYDELWKETYETISGHLDTLAEQTRSHGVEVTTGVLRGSAAFALLAEIQPTDLVVMTSHGRGGFRRWLLGSVAEKLVREAQAPVLLVPTRTPDDAHQANPAR
jgi:nucleotide-binding universal stress UspA family protein